MEVIGLPRLPAEILANEIGPHCDGPTRLALALASHAVNRTLFASASAETYGYKFSYECVRLGYLNLLRWALEGWQCPLDTAAVEQIGDCDNVALVDFLFRYRLRARDIARKVKPQRLLDDGEFLFWSIAVVLKLGPSHPSSVSVDFEKLLADLVEALVAALNQGSFNIRKYPFAFDCFELRLYFYCFFEQYYTEEDPLACTLGEARFSRLCEYLFEVSPPPSLPFPKSIGAHVKRKINFLFSLLNLKSRNGVSSLLSWVVDNVKSEAIVESHLDLLEPLICASCALLYRTDPRTLATLKMICEKEHFGISRFFSEIDYTLEGKAIILWQCPLDFVKFLLTWAPSAPYIVPKLRQTLFFVLATRTRSMQSLSPYLQPGEAFDFELIRQGVCRVVADPYVLMRYACADPETIDFTWKIFGVNRIPHAALVLLLREGDEYFLDQGGYAKFKPWLLSKVEAPNFALDAPFLAEYFLGDHILGFPACDFDTFVTVLSLIDPTYHRGIYDLLYESGVASSIRRGSFSLGRNKIASLRTVLKILIIKHAVVTKDKLLAEVDKCVSKALVADRYSYNILLKEVAALPSPDLEPQS